MRLDAQAPFRMSEAKGDRSVDILRGLARALVHREPPAEADPQRFFKVSLPSVHAMILTLERLGLIEWTPGRARSIRLRVLTAELAELK